MRDPRGVKQPDPECESRVPWGCPCQETGALEHREPVRADSVHEHDRPPPGERRRSHPFRLLPDRLGNSTLSARSPLGGGPISARVGRASSAPTTMTPVNPAARRIAMAHRTKRVLFRTIGGSTTIRWGAGGAK